MSRYSLRDVDRMGDRFLDPPEDTRCSKCGEEGGYIKDGHYRPFEFPDPICDECRGEEDEDSEEENA